MLAGYYRLNDIMREVDRDKSTLLRWEKEGLIPKAKRDNRGWRFYTGEDFQEIIRLIEKTRYVQQ